MQVPEAARNPGGPTAAVPVPEVLSYVKMLSFVKMLSMGTWAFCLISMFVFVLDTVISVATGVDNHPAGAAFIHVFGYFVMLAISIVSVFIGVNAGAAIKRYRSDSQRQQQPPGSCLSDQPPSQDTLRLWVLLRGASVVLMMAALFVAVASVAWCWCLTSTTSAAPSTPLASAVNTALTAANASHSISPAAGVAPANTTITTPLSALQDRLSALETTVSGIVKNSTGAALTDDALYTPPVLAVIRIMRCAKVAFRGWADRAAKGLGYQPISPP
jgi:hypothetical protein